MVTVVKRLLERLELAQLGQKSSNKSGRSLWQNDGDKNGQRKAVRKSRQQRGGHEGNVRGKSVYEPRVSPRALAERWWRMVQSGRVSRAGPRLSA